MHDQSNQQESTISLLKEEIQKLNLNLEENETNFKNDLANEKSAFDDEKWELNGEIDDLKDQL